MQCPRCQAENRAGRRFCGECGLSLALTCQACGFLNEGSEKFCGGCGAPTTSSGATSRPSSAPESYTPKHLAERILTSKAALEGERKQVTVLFADLKGSMELLADRDLEEARKILDPVARTHDGSRASLRRHGESGDGRRDHGAVRRAPRPWGPRGASLLCGAADAVVGAEVCRGGLSRVGCWRRAEMRMTLARPRADRPAPEVRVA